MFQNIEELKNEIDIFRNNMNRSNGSIAMISEAIEKLNTNTYTLKQISEQVDLTRRQLEAKAEKVDKLQEQMLEQFKIAKVLSGVTIGLLVLSIVLNIVC